jgi:DNA polymerase III delta prime subunit
MYGCTVISKARNALPSAPSIIRELVSELGAMLNANLEMSTIIRHPQLLIQALEEFDTLIEMYDIKVAIARQIKLMIVLALKHQSEGKSGSKFDGHMLHGVIYGPPGVGKSTAAKSIAKIFHAIGVMECMTKSVSIPVTEPRRTRSLPPRIVRPVNRLHDTIVHEAGQILTNINSFNRTAKSIEVQCGKSLPEEAGRLRTLIKTGTEIGLRCANIIELCHVDSEGEEEAVDVPPGAATLAVLPPTLPPTLPNGSDRMGRDPPVPARDPVPIVICGRSEFVGEFAGHTTIKTHNFLMEHRGKVVVIEEAYLLYTGDRDLFGMEALTEINRFMDEHAKEIIIYFTGYKELMEATIFKAQPGLRRRCEQVFNIKG